MATNQSIVRPISSDDHGDDELDFSWTSHHGTDSSDRIHRSIPLDETVQDQHEHPTTGQWCSRKPPLLLLRPQELRDIDPTTDSNAEDKSWSSRSSDSSSSSSPRARPIDLYLEDSNEHGHTLLGIPAPQAVVPDNQPQPFIDPSRDASLPPTMEQPHLPLTPDSDPIAGSPVPMAASPVGDSMGAITAAASTGEGSEVSASDGSSPKTFTDTCQATGGSSKIWNETSAAIELASDLESPVQDIIKYHRRAGSRRPRSSDDSGEEQARQCKAQRLRLPRTKGKKDDN